MGPQSAEVEIRVKTVTHSGSIPGGDRHLFENDKSENCEDGLWSPGDLQGLRGYLHRRLLPSPRPRNLFEGNFGGHHNCKPLFSR